VPTVTYEYAVIRVVPRVERQEFINVGILLSSQPRRFLQAALAPDWQRLQAFAPQLDRDLVKEHLALIPRICAGGPDGGPIGALPLRERFHWLTAPRSTIIQLSPVHSGLCEDPAAALEKLMQCLVHLPAI
jgi:hypothetical protein